MRRRAGAMWHWMAGHQFLTALILIGVFVAAGFWRDQIISARDRERAEETRVFVACMADWARDVTDRTSKVLTSRQQIDDASDDLWRTFAALLAAPRPDAREEFQRHLDLYVGASDQHRQVQRDNPVPDPPRIRC